MSGVTQADVLRLAEPTPPGDIKQRQGPGGRMLDYIDARFVMERLDELGPGNWQDRYEDRPNGSVRCGIGINVEGEWVWKWDVGDESDIEADKGAHSGAFKRAGVKWGIGRDLYGHTTNGNGRATPPPARPSAAPSRPTLVEPEWMDESGSVDAEGTCPDHDLAWVLRPGGTSKTTGKPYDPFWACPSDERPYCKNRPSRAWAARHEE
jgi:hypothetical protein